MPGMGEMVGGWRLTSLAVVLALVAACAGQPGSPLPATPPPIPTASAAPRATTNPCSVGLTLLGAFTQRLAGDLASIRPLAAAAVFDSASTLTAIRRVSETLTAFPGLEASLMTCPQTVDLATRVASLTAAAQDSVDGSQSSSVNAAQVQREAGVSLVNLLPEVLDLSRTAKRTADGMALGITIAQVPEDSIGPTGSLVPLPTQTPSPTPQPTPKPPKVATIAAPFFGKGVKIATYRVTGATPGAITRAMDAAGPRSSWTSGRASGLTSVSSTYRFVFATDGYGGCRIHVTASPAIVLGYRVTLPRWSPASGASPSTIQWWNGELLDIARHEKVHVDLYKAAAKRLNSTLASSTCANARRRLDAVWKAVERKNCEYDMKEYGSAMGLSLESCLAR